VINFVKRGSLQMNIYKPYGVSDINGLELNKE
jgi:hypothetical protein